MSNASPELVELADRVEEKLSRLQSSRETCSKWLKQLDIFRNFLHGEMRDMTCDLAKHEEPALNSIPGRGPEFRFLIPCCSIDDAIDRVEIGKPAKSLELLKEACLYKVAAVVYPLETQVTLLVKAITREELATATRETARLAKNLVAAVKAGSQQLSSERALVYIESALDKEEAMIEEKIMKPIDSLALDLKAEAQDNLEPLTILERRPKDMSQQEWQESPDTMEPGAVSEEQRQIADRVWDTLDDTSDRFSDDRPGDREFVDTMEDFTAAYLLSRCRAIDLAFRTARACPYQGHGCERGSDHQTFTHDSFED